MNLAASASPGKPGAALLIVLAFVVILSGLAVAYLSRTGTDRQLAHGTFNESRADILARSALDLIVGDLKQEIALGSTSSTVNGAVIYNPIQPAYIQPTRSGNPPGTPDPAPNLIRRSVQSDPITSPGVSSHASAVNSTTDVSSNGRSISLARWNKHYLIPRAAGLSSPNDTTPIASFVAPDWVLVTTTGPAMLTTPSAAVLGRYAYAIYDEGGLIDINVAGYPPDPNTTVLQYGPKGLLSFADLTAVGMSTSSENDLVGWRNYASAQPSGSFGGFTFTPATATNYFNAVIPSTNDFLTTNGTVWNNGTDQKFVTRQMLIEYRQAVNFSADAMRYLGTFSRERNVSTWNNSQIPRFPIAKLNEVLPTGDAARIKADFGLVWNSDHWDYYGRAGATLASSIAAFDYANPEFFQLLNYALPGRSTGDILTVGASIIDQNDTDQNTTIIEYAANPSVSPNPRAYGVEVTPAPAPAPTPPTTPTVLNRALRSVGEFGYAYDNISSGQTLNFTLNPATDAGVLDLFSYTSATVRAGVVNLNTRNSSAMVAVLSGAIEAQPSATPSRPRRDAIAARLVAATSSSPALSRQDLARLTAAVIANLGTSEENREVVSRALSDLCQTRTWNLMIDVIAQSGKYPPTANNPSQFVVEGEKRYWLHIAIDRFTGEVIDQQLEAVYE